MNDMRSAHKSRINHYCFHRNVSPKILGLERGEKCASQAVSLTNPPQRIKYNRVHSQHNFAATGMGEFILKSIARSLLS
jgi:hypothetical protein